MIITQCVYYLLYVCKEMRTRCVCNRPGGYFKGFKNPIMIGNFLEVYNFFNAMLHPQEVVLVCPLANRVDKQRKTYYIINHKGSVG